MKSKEKLGLQDSPVDALTKLSEGNPGAANVLMLFVQHNDNIDPDAVGGGFLGTFMFDTLGIYGSRIWMLYKDVCNQDIVEVMVVLRGWQLGYLSKDVLDHAIDNRGQGLDKEELFAMVKKRLPAFKIEARKKK